MTQRNQEQSFSQFKLIFIMYVGALAGYSSWSQGLGDNGDVKSLYFSQ